MLDAASDLELGEEDIARFREDGFLVIERLVAPVEAKRLRDRFEPMFRGDFETGLHPDEWNWAEGRDPPDVTRQICNAWKSDRTLAARVLSAEVGRICARLAGWPGARIGQDNMLWKPAGAKPIGFHQDDAYCRWVVPPHYVSLWLALDDTAAEGGTLEYARGSHEWGVTPPRHAFHAPDDYRAALREAAAAAGAEVPEIVPVEVPAGGGSIHDGRTWHGSAPNRTDARPALGRRPLRLLAGPLPPERDQLHLQPLQARRRRGDGRELLPRPVARGRLPDAVHRSLCRRRPRALSRPVGALAILSARADPSSPPRPPCTSGRRSCPAWCARTG